MSVVWHNDIFFGWRVVGAAFVLAVLGWGTGFYGLPIYLQTVQENRGWAVALISIAVTTHFVVGAVVVANLPTLHARFGIPNVTKADAIFLAVGVLGRASAAAPWQLFVTTLFSGTGWAAMGGAAVNAIVSPCFVRTRPAALSMAYNGASIGGVVFSPLWVAGIGLLGFPLAAAAIGVVMALTMWVLADRLLSRTPQQMGLQPDNDIRRAPLLSAAPPVAPPRAGSSLWQDPKFLTLSAGGGGYGVGHGVGYRRSHPRWLGDARRCRSTRCSFCELRRTNCRLCGVDSRGGHECTIALSRVVLFGAGIGNATSLLPLISQVEFPENRVPRVVALTVAVAQAAYAFAPATFGLVGEFAPHAAGAASSAAPGLFAATAFVQGLAICAFLLGRGPRKASV